MDHFGSNFVVFSNFFVENCDYTSRIGVVGGGNEDVVGKGFFQAMNVAISRNSDVLQMDD